MIGRAPAPGPEGLSYTGWICDTRPRLIGVRLFEFVGSTAAPVAARPPQARAYKGARMGFINKPAPSR